MRKVKCRITGECGYDYEFYKAPNGKYYKSKEIYDEAIIQREYRNKIIYLINIKILNKNISNYGSLIGKLISEAGVMPEAIYESLIDKLDYIKELIDESTENDISKIHIIFSIATKSLNKITYAGCYEIRNTETNEVYIGESINLFSRLITHISELYENKHHCKSLQDAFNKNKSIRNFTITPLFMFPISSIDKNEAKQETLYLESAFYLICKDNQEKLYNTQDPYVALKNNSVSLDQYQIDCNKILHLLANDKYNVIPSKLLESIKKDLRDFGILNTKSINENNANLCTSSSENNDKNIFNRDIEMCHSNKYIEECIEYTNTLLQKNTPLYRITNLLKEFANEGILPKDYNYTKIRNILIDNNLITIDSSNHTVATDYALQNQFYYISNVSIKKGIPVYNYYLSEKCKELLIDVFSHYENIDELRKVS